MNRGAVVRGLPLANIRKFKCDDAQALDRDRLARILMVTEQAWWPERFKSECPPQGAIEGLLQDGLARRWLFAA